MGGGGEGGERASTSPFFQVMPLIEWLSLLNESSLEVVLKAVYQKTYIGLLPGQCRTKSQCCSSDLVSVVASVEIWEDTHICLTSNFTVRLDFLLCNIRVHSCIILNWTCSRFCGLLRPTDSV